jgi:hypothetical protein
VSRPTYDLQKVIAASRRHDIEYRGRVVQRDISNLGYELADVARCLAQLSVTDYRKSIYYEDRPADDVYISRFAKSGCEETMVDHLYIKFCLISDILIIDLASFHLRRL